MVLCALVLCNLPNAYTASFAASQAERLLLVGQAYEDKGDFARSLQAYRGAVNLSPKDANAHAQLGQTLMRSGRIEQAAHHFHVAGMIVPESEAPKVLLGQAMSALGDYDKAVANFREALERNPYQREALRELGRILSNSGHHEAAIAILSRYLQAGYQDDEVAFQLARLLLARNGRADTIRFFFGLKTRYPRWRYLRELTEQLAEADQPQSQLDDDANTAKRR